MTDLALIFVGALIVNNFVLAQFLGLCPFMGVTKNLDTALAMGLATTFVLTLSASMSWLVYHAMLVPLNAEYLKIVVFIVLIAGVVQAVELYLKSLSPLLHQVLGVYLPLITSNCAVLGVALLALGQDMRFGESVVYSIGAAGGFTLVMALFGALREQLVQSTVPAAFRGAPIALVAAGIMSLAFMGFAGLGSITAASVP